MGDDHQQKAIQIPTQELPDPGGGRQWQALRTAESLLELAVLHTVAELSGQAGESLVRVHPREVYPPPPGPPSTASLHGIESVTLRW